MNTTLHSGATRVKVAERQANQENAASQQQDLAALVAQRKAAREKAAEERAARVRAQRLEAASRAGSEAGSDFDPSGRAAGTAAAARSAAALPAVPNRPAGSLAPSNRVAALGGSVKPAMSTQSTDGSRPKAERLSIGSKPLAVAAAAEAEAVPRTAAPDAKQQEGEPIQAQAAEAGGLAGAAPGAGTAAPVAVMGTAAAAAHSSGAVASLPIAPPASSAASRQPTAGPAKSRRPAGADRVGAGAMPAGPPAQQQQQPVRAQRAQQSSAQRAAPSAAAATSRGPARASLSHAAAAPQQAPPAAAAAVAQPAAAPLSADEQALAEERHAELATGYGQYLALRLVNCHLDAMLAGPEYEGQPLPAAQLPVHAAPSPVNPTERLQQVEAAAALQLQSLAAQQAENEEARAGIAEELARAGLGQERREELESTLRAIEAFEARLAHARSVLAHWLQAARADATVGLA